MSKSQCICTYNAATRCELFALGAEELPADGSASGSEELFPLCGGGTEEPSAEEPGAEEPSSEERPSYDANTNVQLRGYGAHTVRLR